MGRDLLATSEDRVAKSEMSMAGANEREARNASRLCTDGRQQWFPRALGSSLGSSGGMIKVQSTELLQVIERRRCWNHFSNLELGLSF